MGFFVPIVAFAMLAFPVIVVAGLSEDHEVVRFRAKHIVPSESRSMPHVKSIDIVDVSEYVNHASPLFNFRNSSRRFAECKTIIGSEEAFILNKNCLNWGHVRLPFILRSEWKWIVLLEATHAYNHVFDVCRGIAPILHFNFDINSSSIGIHRNPWVDRGHFYVSALDGFGGSFGPFYQLFRGLPKIGGINNKESSDDDQQKSERCEKEFSRGKNESTENYVFLPFWWPFAFIGSWLTIFYGGRSGRKDIF